MLEGGDLVARHSQGCDTQTSRHNVTVSPPGPLSWHAEAPARLQYMDNVYIWPASGLPSVLPGDASTRPDDGRSVLNETGSV